jgi:hypothetical protein
LAIAWLRLRRSTPAKLGLCGESRTEETFRPKAPCQVCGLETTRDHRSAWNILRRGLRLVSATPAMAGVLAEAPNLSYGRGHQRKPKVTGTEVRSLPCVVNMR